MRILIINSSVSMSRRRYIHHLSSSSLLLSSVNNNYYHNNTSSSSSSTTSSSSLNDFSSSTAALAKRTTTTTQLLTKQQHLTRGFAAKATTATTNNKGKSNKTDTNTNNNKKGNSNNIATTITTAEEDKNDDDVDEDVEEESNRSSMRRTSSKSKEEDDKNVLKKTFMKPKTDFGKSFNETIKVNEYVNLDKNTEILCNAIEREFKFTKSNGLLYRKCDDDLMNVVHSLIGEEKSNKIHLRGYRGAGKSVSLAMLVLRERALGSLVVYIPRASHIVTRTSYQKHGEEENGMWDTPDAARLLLNAVLTSNEDKLGKIQTARDGKQNNNNNNNNNNNTLLDLVKVGLEKANDQTVTQNALDVIDELVKQKDFKVVFAIDEHNALFGPSDMHEVRGPRSRRNIHSDRLRLASKLRSCVPLANGGKYIACDSTEVGAKPNFSEDEFDFEIPKFNVSETHALLKHYEEVGKCANASSEIALEFKSLTNGKVKEIHEYLMFSNA
jgi:hypothetical protein